MTEQARIDAHNELLAACKAIMPHLESELLAHEPWAEEIDALRAAISKAEDTPCDQPSK